MFARAFLLLLTSLTGLLPAEEPAWLIRTWDTDDGLPQNSVVSLAQTEDGYLWAATLLGGVGRFDGVRFVNFEPANTPQLRSPEAHLLFPAEDGSLLVAQNGGAVARWKEGRFTDDFSEENPDARRPGSLLRDVGGVSIFWLQGGGLQINRRLPGGGMKREFIELPESQSMPVVWSEKVGGRVWYSGRDGSLRWWQDGVSHIEPMPQLSGKTVLSLARSPDGQVWLGTSGGIAEITDRGVIDRTPPGAAAKVEQLVFDQAGRLWTRGGGRVRSYDAGRWAVEVTGLPPELAGGVAGTHLQMIPSHDGSLWLLHRHAGLWQVMPDGAIRHPGAADGLPGGLVECGLMDREGSLWVGFNGGGLARVRPRHFQVLRDTVEPPPVIRSICQDDAGSLWMGHSDGRLVQWTAGRSQDWALQGETGPGQRILPVRDVTVWPDRAGQLWVGSVGQGAWILQAGQFRRPFPPGAIGTVVRAGLCDRTGRVWIGSENGLFSYQDGRLESWKTPKGEVIGYVLAMTEGADGTILATTAKGGLWRWKLGKLQHWSLPDGMDYRLWALHPGAENSYWIGSLMGGLFRWKDGKFARLTKQDGLPGDTITQLLKDDRGQLWIGSREGIFSMPEAAAHAWLDGRGPRPVCRAFNRSDGLPAMECSGGFHPACLKAVDGRLWFSTVKGAVSLVPGSIPDNPLPPPVRIEELSVNGQFPGFPAMALSLAGLPVELGPGDFSLEFRFTANSLVAPEKNQFQWQMEGWEDRWVDGGTSRTARYGFLPPGRYLFKVQATNNDGVLSVRPAELSVVISPFYWQTLWFRTIVPLVLVMAGGWILQAALRRRHRRQLEELARRQALANERARIARDLHDDLGASLTQLTWLCEAAGQEISGSAGTGQRLTDIGARARSMVRSIDAIVWAVNPRNDSLDQLAHYICQFAEDFLRGTPLRCRLDVPDDLPPAGLDATLRHEAFLIAREAIHNAARHSGARELQIRIRADASHAEIRIAEEGQGFDPPILPGGDGLRNMRTRAATHGLDLVIEAAPGQGCRVTLKLPLILAGPTRPTGWRRWLLRNHP